MFKFKKVASLLASTLMVGSTFALAATAANYPAPFVQGGNADVAIIYGSGAQSTDLVAAIDISTNLHEALISQGGDNGDGDGGTTVDGEAYPLFTSSSELFMNSTLNSVRTTLTSTELPIILADDAFEGASSIQYTQKIVLGSNPKVDFAQMPTSDDDPKAGISFSTAPSTTPLYNATVTFDSAVNFTHADSIGEDIMLFGQKFTVGAATTSSKLVLLKSSQTIDLSSDVNPSAEVTVEGETYTVEITAATDTSATIKVTDSSGDSETKEISESTSKTVLGVEVSVDLADENNNRVTATVSVGSNRVTLQDGSAVKRGSDEDTVDGTNVEWYDATGIQTSNPANITRIDFQIAAADSDMDAIFPGQAFVDPVFGSFKVDFAGINIPLDSTTDRELIDVKPSGNDKATVTFQAYAASEPKTTTWAFNKTTAEGTTEGAGIGGMILADADGDVIRVAEGVIANKSQYVVIPNDADGGGLYEITAIYNSSSSTASDDYVRLKNVMTGAEEDHKAASEGSITATVEGKTVTILYNGAATAAQELRQARFNSPESSSNGMVLFPTIKTKTGAKVAFYQPTRINLENFNGVTVAGYVGNVSSFEFPDGDGYTSVTVARDSGGGAINGGGTWNFTFGSTTRQVNTSAAAGASSGLVTIGRLTYNITSFAAATPNSTVLYLQNPEGGNIVRPALIIFEEKDDLNNYEAAIVTLDGGYDGANNDLGVADIIRTYGADSASLGNEIQLETDNDLYQDMDFWGTLYTIDKSDTDQASATISYPDDQVEAEVFVAEETATFSGENGGGGTQGSTNIVSIADTQAAAVSSKHWIVIGGSCVNTVAADLLGSATPLCGADFTATTNVGAGQFMIETFGRDGGKVATLVAGYNAGDTTNAATYLTTQDVMTDVDKKYIGTSATTASLVSEDGSADA